MFEEFEVNTLSVDPSGVAKRRRLPERVSRLALLRLAKGFLKRFDFHAAALTLDEIGRPDLALASRYAAARLEFDFDGASDCYRRLLKRIDGDGAFARRLEHLKPALGDLVADAGEGVNAARLVELCHAASVVYESGALTDYLARLRCLLELAIERFCAARGVVTNVPDREAHRFTASLEREPGLKKYLETCSVNGQKLDLRKPTFPVMQGILQYFLLFDRKPDRTLWQSVDRLIRETQERNKTVIAHGTEGISAEKIAAKDLAPEGLPRKVFEGLGMRIGDSPYVELSRMIAGELKARPR